MWSIHLTLNISVHLFDFVGWQCSCSLYLVQVCLMWTDWMESSKLEVRSWSKISDPKILDIELSTFCSLYSRVFGPFRASLHFLSRLFFPRTKICESSYSQKMKIFTFWTDLHFLGGIKHPDFFLFLLSDEKRSIILVENEANTTDDFKLRLFSSWELFTA